MIPIDPTMVQGNSDVLNIVTTLFQQRISIIKELMYVIAESEMVLHLIKQELGELDDD